MKSRRKIARRGASARLSILLSLLLALILLSSCATSPKQEVASPPSESVGATEAATAAVEAPEKKEAAEKEDEKTTYPLELTDSSGRKVKLAAKPQRLVSLGPNMTELCFALGAESRLVGRTEYCDYPKEALERPSIGTLLEPDLEKIAEISPDLVLASTHVSDKTMESLDKLGIPVLMLYDEAHMDGLFEIVQILGQALDLREQADRLNSEMRSRIDAVKEKLRGAPRKSLYYVVGFGEGGEYTAGGNTFINDILLAAAAENIAAEVSDWSFSLEKLTEANPEIIILPAWAESFLTTEPYKNLAAVKKGQAFLIDNNLFDRQGPRNVEAIELLAKLIHPELFD